MNKQYTEKQIQSYTKRFNKLITENNWQDNGFLEPYEIDWEYMDVRGPELCVKCICHYPGCQTKTYTVRADKLKGKTISCLACSKKARNDPNFPQFMKKKIEVGKTYNCWYIDAFIPNYLKKELGLSSNSKYSYAHCIYCGATKIKNNDHLKDGDDSCTCQTGSENERKIAHILSSFKINFEPEFPLQEQRIDFAIKNKNNQPLLFIEYDGEFHDIAGDIEHIQLNQKRDKNKNNKIIKMNIPLLRIHHSQQNLITEEWLQRQIEKEIGPLSQLNS